MDKQVIDVDFIKQIMDHNNIQKEMMDMKVDTNKKINELEKQVIKNSTKIENIEGSVTDIKNLVGDLYNRIGRFTDNLDTRFDRIEDKIDKNSDKFNTINEQLLVRRLINRIIEKHPKLTQSVLIMLISTLAMILFYLLALFVNS